MFFVMLGIMAGCVGGVLRSIYFAVKYNEHAAQEPTNKVKILRRRIFIGFLYVFFIYTVIINFLEPVQW